MNSLAYYAVRIGLLCVILLLGLIAYAPETLDLVGVWNDANEKSEYMVETQAEKQVVRGEKEESDSQMMLDAINTDLNTVKYVFAKNRFRTYNQRDWWPPIFASAIEADNIDVMQYFLDEGYGCDYSDVPQGIATFKAAVASADAVYLEMLLSSECGTAPAAFRPNLEALISNSNYPERLTILSASSE